MVDKPILSRIKQILLDDPTAKATVLAQGQDVDKPMGCHLKISSEWGTYSVFYQSTESLVDTVFAAEDMITAMGRDGYHVYFPQPSGAL